jgi:transcriptional regulator of acetoin/glycerol metabolism
MSDVLRSLAAVPLANLLATASETLRSATLDEISTIFTGGSPKVDSTDQLAEMILALPVEGPKLDAVQRAVVLRALAVSGGNVSAAARLLGVERKAFERKVSRARRQST